MTAWIVVIALCCLIGLVYRIFFEEPEGRTPPASDGSVAHGSAFAPGDTSCGDGGGGGGGCD